MNLRLKILAILLSVILLVSTVLIWAGFATQQVIEERYAVSTQHARSLVWRSVVNDTLDGVKGVVTKMTRDRALKKALVAGDAQQVSEQIGPIYSMLAAQGMVDRVGVFDQGQRFLAMQGQASVPSNTNLAVSQVVNTGKVASGLVLTEDGEPMAIVATPLSKRGKAIGGAALMRTLEWAVQQFTRRSEAEAGLYLGRRLLWQSEHYVAGLVDDPEQLEDYAILDQAERSFVVTRHAVEDVKGNPIAQLVVLKDYSESIQGQRLQQRIALIVSLLVVGAAMFLSYLLLTRMLRPLGSLGEALKKISSGDLSVDIERNGSSEIIVLQESAQQMVIHLRELLQEIQQATDRVAERALTMTQSAQGGLDDVGTQREQVHHLMESVGRLEETSSEVEHRAVEASARTEAIDGEVAASRQVVESSSKNILHLEQQIGQSSEVVRKVREHSDRIRAFLVIIQEVAEQTNLLALNAAIESARAGEMGRGFAVVADEVRNLSHRTTQNTREIQNVIEELHQISKAACESMEESVRIAHQSVGTSGQTNDSLVKIVSSVEEIRSMSSAIASMASEQHQMSGGMLEYVSAVDATSQQAEGQAHEVVASCDHLVEVANNLRALVGRFRV